MKPHDSNVPYRIIVIDDNTAIQEDFRKILVKKRSTRCNLDDMEAALFGIKPQESSLVTFEIDFASQGQEGLKMVQKAQSEQRPYAVAFVDGRMPPGWDGIETIKHLWQACSELQVVLCTAYADYSWQQIRSELGESDNWLILKKPFDNVEVLQLAHALTRKWELNREIMGRLNRLAYYDNLTDLPNRTLFIDRLCQILENSRRYDHKSALLFIDMDNFKRINDTLGHTAGDDLLKNMAERLTRCLRASDTVARPVPDDMAARIGGDEFTVILPKLDKKEEASTVALRIAEHMAQPVVLGSHQVIVTPSIGIAIFPQDGDDVETLLKNADLAMYFAKRTGPNKSAFYQESMNADALKRLAMENHLRRAIARDEFRLQYQPQFDLCTGDLSGFEALLRWKNWELGHIPPMEFIPLVEESGLIIDIGQWVIRTVCRQAVQWLNQGLEFHRIAVNVSAMQLTHPHFMEMLKNTLAETGLPPHRLEFEITESVIVNDAQTVKETFRTLKEMNIRIAVDDFGTGYSSLARLNEMPIDCLKIDRSFIWGIDSGAKDQSIISAIIAMAEGLNLTVIAEGVETPGQADFLRNMQCQQAQGFLFSHPLSSHQVEDFLRKSTSSCDCKIDGQKKTMIKPDPE